MQQLHPTKLNRPVIEDAKEIKIPYLSKAPLKLYIIFLFSFIC